VADTPNRHLAAWEGAPADPFAVLEADVGRLLRDASEAAFAREQAQQQTITEVRRFLVTMVELLDAFDRVFRAVAEKDAQVTPLMKIWLSNFRSVRRMVESALSAEGVVKLENLADVFDPQWHRVAELRADPDRPDGTILEIDKPGYLWRKEVLRKAEVVVVQNGE
jgi:molecular chaperone GrpE